VLGDTHPPIYYLVLRLSSTVFGQSEIAARAPSMLFGLLTVCAAAGHAGVLAEPAVARLQRSWSRLGEIPSLHEVTARSCHRGPSDQRS
jgi:uncharacterized membrane protein